METKSICCIVVFVLFSFLFHVVQGNKELEQEIHSIFDTLLPLDYLLKMRIGMKNQLSWKWKSALLGILILLLLCIWSRRISTRMKMNHNIMKRKKRLQSQQK